MYIVNSMHVNNYIRDPQTNLNNLNNDMYMMYFFILLLNE